MTDVQQLWLPFDFIEEEKQIDWSDLPHFENPTTDNDCLFELQYQYRVNGNQQALTQIYLMCEKIAGKFISKETRVNRHIKHLSVEERTIKAADAAIYIVQSYLKKPKWAIYKSFTGYIYKRVQHELYYKRKVDDIVDFVDLATFFKEGEEDEDLYKWTCDRNN